MRTTSLFASVTCSFFSFTVGLVIPNMLHTKYGCIMLVKVNLPVKYLFPAVCTDENTYNLTFMYQRMHNVYSRTLINVL